MPYVQRDESGRIIGRYANAQEGYAEEFLQDEHTEIIALERARKDAEFNQSIITQLRENDLKAMRSVIEGDAARIDVHKATQAALRAQLKAVK